MTALLTRRDARQAEHPMSASTTGKVGFGFVVLLFVSAGMASIPTRADGASLVRDYYAEHTASVALAQLIGLGAAVAFGFFARGLESAGRRPDRTLRIAGTGVAVAAVITAIPPLWSCVVAVSASSSTLHALVVASDLTDIVLFVAIGAFGAVVVRTGATWLRGIALATALVSLAHAGLLLVGARPLDVVAPLAFIVLVLALSAAAMRLSHHPSSAQLQTPSRTAAA